MEHGTLRPNAKFWFAVCVLDGCETLHDVFEETNTQRHGTLERFVGSKRPDSDVIPLGFLCLDVGRQTTSAYSKEKQPHRIAVGPWARPPVLLLALRQASYTPFSSFTDTSSRAVAHAFKSCVSPARKNIRSFSSVTHWKQRSAPGFEARGLQGSGAPTTFNSFGSPLQATLSFPPRMKYQQPQGTCGCHRRRSATWWCRPSCRPLHR